MLLNDGLRTCSLFRCCSYFVVGEQLRQRLIQAGYDRIERLPNEKNDPRWNDVRSDCELSRPEMNEVINALFPAPTPSCICFSFLRLSI
jgi:hypothetical protein